MSSNTKIFIRILKKVYFKQQNLKKDVLALNMKTSQERLLDQLQDWTPVSALPDLACLCQRRVQQLLSQLKEAGCIIEKKQVGKVKHLRIKPWTETQKPYLTNTEKISLDYLLYTTDAQARAALQKVLSHT